MNRRFFVVTGALCVVVVFSLIAVLGFSNASARAGRPKLAFDVATNAFSFSFEGDVNENGFPANGTPFIIHGYIYPAGTFEAHGALSGVNADGSAEFPNLVRGIWICRGWHVQDGDATSGPVVATTQIFDLDPERRGLDTLTSDGIELADFDVPFHRAITGGTGKFRGAKGQHSQVTVGNGVNASGGYNSSFEFPLRDPGPRPAPEAEEPPTPSPRPGWPPRWPRGGRDRDPGRR